MTFLLQTQKLFMSNAWNLTKLIKGYDSKTSKQQQLSTHSAAGVVYPK